MIEVDDKTALMNQKEFDNLPDYSCSIPSLTTIGKRWKRSESYCKPREKWLMGEYVEIGSADKVGIKWREIMIC